MVKRVKQARVDEVIDMHKREVAVDVDKHKSQTAKVSKEKKTKSGKKTRAANIKFYNSSNIRIAIILNLCPFLRVYIRVPTGDYT